MPRPRTVDKEKHSPLSRAEVDARQEELDAKISSFLRRLLEAEGISMSNFSRQIGFSQANLSNVFNPARKANHWSIPLLIAVAHALKLPVGDFISKAEAFTDTPGDNTIALFLACRGTRPRSRDRLQRLIWAAVGYDPATEKKSDRFLLELPHDVRSFEEGELRFCELYYAGSLSDQEVFEHVKRAFEWARHEDRELDEGNPPLPLWMALRRTWSPAPDGAPGECGAQNGSVAGPSATAEAGAKPV